MFFFKPSSYIIKYHITNNLKGKKEEALHQLSSNATKFNYLVPIKSAQEMLLSDTKSKETFLP